MVRRHVDAVIIKQKILVDKRWFYLKWNIRAEKGDHFHAILFTKENRITASHGNLFNQNSQILTDWKCLLFQPELKNFLVFPTNGKYSALIFSYNSDRPQPCTVPSRKHQCHSNITFSSHWITWENLEIQRQWFTHLFFLWCHAGEMEVREYEVVMVKSDRGNDVRLGFEPI